VLEYDEALDKRVKFPDFSVILVLLEGQSAPHWPSPLANEGDRSRSVIDYRRNRLRVRVSAYGISHQWLRRPRKRIFPSLNLVV
jgi:hypothetical protein